MPLFITAVLLAAALQSCCKLSLLDRKTGFLLAAVLAGLVFQLAQPAAAASLMEFRAMLSDVRTLNELCGLAIIQEFASIILGFSLLGENKPPVKWYEIIAHYLKFSAFLPSVLLYYGVWYWQMYLFNRFIEYPFADLTLVSAVILPVAALAVMEAVRFIFRDRDRRILAVMHSEYLLIVPAIFLPVAANAKLIPMGKEKFPFDTLITLGCFASIVFISTIFFIIHHKKTNRKGVSCHK